MQLLSPHWLNNEIFNGNSNHPHSKGGNYNNIDVQATKGHRDTESDAAPIEHRSFLTLPNDVGDSGHRGADIENEPSNNPPLVRAILMTENVQNNTDWSWYKYVPDKPDLSRATTFDICRATCHEWGRKAGFNIVSLAEDMYIPKWTFVFNCKGRIARTCDATMDPSKRRTRNTQYAEYGQKKCPFR